MEFIISNDEWPCFFVMFPSGFYFMVSGGWCRNEHIVWKEKSYKRHGFRVGVGHYAIEVGW